MVLVAVSSTMVMGFAALSVDLGVMYAARAELQRTADAAAMAAAGRLSAFAQGDPQDLARQAATEYAYNNPVLGEGVGLDTAVDVEFGRAELDEVTGKFNFVPSTEFPDAVRVRVRRTDSSPSGSIPLYFANIFGISSTDMAATAIAMFTPRDMAVVADLSGSHTDDSELRHYKMTDINLWDVWAALPGGMAQGDPGYDPMSAGPNWNTNMTHWGTDPITTNYDPTTDDGLFHLPKYQNWNDATIADLLTQRGYSLDEVDAIMGGGYDSGWSSDPWKNRTAVALGVAHWASGMPGGLWETEGWSPGNGNAYVGNGETTYDVPYPYESGSWYDYIKNYVRSTWNQMYQTNNDFRYRFGPKTFTNYLLERKPRNSQTSVLNQTPTQPMQAVKDSVQYMAERIVELDSNDQLSLEIYGTTARHEVDLTTDVMQVPNRLNEMQAAHYDAWTNMGGGMERAIEELTSTRARGNAAKIIVLLTDGNANVTPSGQAGYRYQEEARAYVLDQANIAVSQGMRIYCVSVGAGADQDLMAQVAAIGKGEHFHAEGTIEQYSAQLDAILSAIGGKRPIALIE